MYKTGYLLANRPLRPAYSVKSWFLRARHDGAHAAWQTKASCVAGPIWCPGVFLCADVEEGKEGKYAKQTSA
jgi:hypothetical protein